MIRFRPAFTPPGFAVLVMGLVLLIRSLSARNAYEILLSAVMLVIWVTLGLVGLWRARRAALPEPMWKPPFPFAANTQEETLITGLGFAAPWFFRLHVIVRGRFFPSGAVDGCPVFVETTVPRRSHSVTLSISFPMSGTFRGEVSCRLKDIFSFFSFRCGTKQQRTVNVVAAPVLRKQLKMVPQSGAEDRRTKSSDDEERYYMREYAPGDRFRDINWKSSERVDTLITRISPDTHEKTCRIEVYFCNYGPSRASLGELWLLDRAKARLAQFLRLLKESDDGYIFDVHTAQGNWELKEKDELELFLEKLAGFPFSPAAEENPVTSDPGELYVFSTACDESLHSFLFACHPRPVSLFLSESAAPGQNPDEVETLAIRDFPLAGCIPSPKWFFRKKLRRLSVSAGRVEKDYAGVRL